MEDDKFMNAIGKRIENLLDENDMSLKTLSKKSGVPLPVLYQLIKGMKKDVSQETILMISMAFGISMSKFYNDPLFEEEQP